MSEQPRNPAGPTDLYRRRPLAAGYPGLEERYVAFKQATLARKAGAPAGGGGLADILAGLDRLVDLSRPPCGVAVIGCGPSPGTVAALLERGFDAVGVEPVAGSLRAAREFLGDASRAVQGTAESLPFPDGSRRVVLMENVLEHVDSPDDSLREVHRVLAPGGVLFVRTSNRWRFSPLGRNFEFNVPFYNWFPRVVRESYVFAHLHYRPRLADFSPRPAVHWYTYPDLCALGRRAGFAQFYSPMDLLSLDRGDDAPGWRKRLLDRLRRNPWLRGLNLTQIGGDIYMWKRDAPAAGPWT